ncbi:hypothetical protein RF11_05935 [Thelohanellus kitauei]|uniref:Uncharacterized protein n=1 Tax=Thelohanellus kitauei TaxID=669202 RepID=A0A0C2N6W6_THEKT|nr:hypothetical protein RF11_05935 [Thelohanellus kitauei]
MTILQTDLKDYYQVEPCIFYVRAMINNTVFPVDSYEVLRIILNFKPHAPSLLIKTSCEFLKDFIDHCENTRNGIQIPGTTFDSIYKWLSQVSVPASQVIMHVGASRKDMVSDNISDCKYLNNILVLCRESNEMTRLARLIGKIIKTTGENDAVLVLQTVLNFHKERVRKQMEYKNDSSESALITIFHMSALSMIMETMGYVNVTFNHLFVTVTETIFLLYDVMKHFKDNENVWESVCNVLVHLFRLSQLYDYNRECLSFFLHDLFEKSPFSSIIVLARIYRNNIWVKYFEEDYISQTCYIIRNETCKFLADKDLNDYPRLIERIMQLLNSILGSAYEDYIDDETTSRLIEFAPQGLLLDNEQAFLECNKLLIELFAHPSISFCTKNRRKVKSHLMGFYDLLIEEIVKNCIDVILSKRNVLFVKTCGNMLRIMKTTERRLIGTHMNIAEDLIYRIWAACPERISSQQRIVDALLKILSASSKEIAEGLAVSLNSKL